MDPTSSVISDMGDQAFQALRDRNDTRRKGFVVVIAIVAAMGGLIFGYDIGGSGATFEMVGFQEEFGWRCPGADAPYTDYGDCVAKTVGQVDREKGLINGLFGAGAAIGAMIAPMLFNNYGRKLTMQVASVVFSIGAACQGGAVNSNMLAYTRLLSGGGIGMLSMCAPVYIGELSPEFCRGQLNTLWQLSITTGILLVSIMNIWLQDWNQGWRISYAGNILFAVIMSAMLLIMPESPRYLVAEGRADEAKAALAKVRFEDQLEWELENVTRDVKHLIDLGKPSWGEIFSSNNNMGQRVGLGMALQMWQQLCGINAIMFYAPSILTVYFGSRGGIYGGLALNFVNFLSTFVTIQKVDSFGRIKLFKVGGTQMCFSLVAVAICSGIAGGSTNPPKTLGYLVISFCALFVIGFAYSWGPVVWVYCAEMFPLRERGRANGLTTFTNWFFSAIVGALFPIASTASLMGCFIFFAVAIFVGTLMVHFCLPETANLTNYEIDELFKNKGKVAGNTDKLLKADELGVEQAV